MARSRDVSELTPALGARTFTEWGMWAVISQGHCEPATFRMRRIIQARRPTVLVLTNST